MSEDIRKMINKVKNIKQFVNENVDIKDLIKTMDYEIVDEGMFKAAYFGENGSALRFRVKTIPNINYGEPVLEMHIDVSENEQGKGMGANMIKVFLYKEGGVAYFSYGRITNENVYKVFEKIKQDPKWLVQDEGNGITIQEA
jgi:hypothetical protein